MSSATQNEPFLARMFVRMTNPAQYLDVGKLFSFVLTLGVCLKMMALQIIDGATLLARSLAFDGKVDRRTTGVSSLANPSFPAGVILCPHAAPARRRQALYCAIFSGSSAPLSDLKWLFTFFANAVDQSFWAPRSNLLRTCHRTSVGRAAYMGVRQFKCRAATSTRQYGGPGGEDSSTANGHFPNWVTNAMKNFIVVYRGHQPQTPIGRAA